MPCSVCLRLSRPARPAISSVGVDDAGGIVGRVDDDGAGARRDGRFYGIEVYLEAVVGVDHHSHAVVVVYVVEVLEEVGGEDDDFFAGVEDGLQHHVGGGCRAAGHGYLVAGEREAQFFAESIGHGLAGLHITGVGHIAMHSGHRLAGKAAQLVLEFGGRLDDRVAQRQVKDVFRSYLGLEGYPFLKDPANPAAFRHELPNLIRYRHGVPSFDMLRTSPALQVCLRV